jgi:hypothetical protein
VGVFIQIVSTTVTFHTNYVSLLSHQNWISTEGGDHWKPIAPVSADFCAPIISQHAPFSFTETRLHGKEPPYQTHPCNIPCMRTAVKMYKVGGIIHLDFYTDLQEEIEERERQSCCSPSTYNHKAADNRK